MHDEQNNGMYVKKYLNNVKDYIMTMSQFVTSNS